MRRIFDRLVRLALIALVMGCGQAEHAPPLDGETAPVGRLDGSVRPLAYRLDLRVDPREETFGGSVEIDVRLDEPRSVLWLHGNGLDVASVTARADVAEATVSGRWQQIHDTGVARVDLDAAVGPGEVTLSFRYEAAFDENLAGLFKVEEQGESYALAKSESIQARRFLPGFDEPGLKATFDVQLTIPAGSVAIGNSPEIDRQPAGEGLERVTFATTPPMSTYLLSLAVGPFDVVEQPDIPANELRDRPVPLRGIARKGRGEDMRFVLDITPEMVELFERELQQPYPYQKLDIIAAPQWPSGATELSAAITYREQILLVGDDPPPGARLRILQVHAHEIAHMWFGNLVTPPWWDDLWLKEGFSSWAESVVLERFEPDGGHDLIARGDALGAMKLDSLASTRAVREPIESNETIRNAYDSITYSKSIGVIHMADRYLGPERFRTALGRYVATFADRAADSDEFYRAIADTTDTPELTEIFRGFVEQPGVPTLDVVRRCPAEGAPSVTIQQARYRPLGSTIEPAATWTIPVCLRGPDGDAICRIMAEPSLTVPLAGAGCPRWVLPNAGGDGYFRWTVEPEIWRALAADFDQLAGTEALAVLDSAFAAFESGHLEVADLWPLVEASALAEEREIVRLPVQRLSGSRRYLEGDESERVLHRWADLYQPVLESRSGSEAPDDRLLSSELLQFLAEVARQPETRRALRDRAHAFTGFGREADPEALDSDLYGAALRVAVEDSPSEFLQHLLEFRQGYDDPRFEASSASALGASGDPGSLDTLHDLVLHGELGTRETAGLLFAAVSDSPLREAHWDWVQEELAAIVPRVPSQWRRRLPRLAASFCTETARDEVTALFATHGESTPGHERALAQTRERIDLCIAQRDRWRSLILDD